MSTELRPTTPGEEEQLWRMRQAQYRINEVLNPRATRSDKGRTKMLNCDRCGETLHKTRIVITTTGLNGKKAGERKRYCSQKCFDKSYRKGLSRLLPI
jgi:hypothetical protein